MASQSSFSVSFSILFLLLSTFSASHAQLLDNFYDATCPGLEATVKTVMIKVLKVQPRMGASILRLHFHDCFVHGCDGSVLLDDTPTFTGEKTASPNLNSARGFSVIDTIKEVVEAVCPATVSCADILALAARDGVVLLGGPTWPVPLGRRDSRTADLNAANTRIPSPFSNLDDLTSSFSAVGLNERDLVALSGAHTIGLARCTQFRSHIYNDTNIDPSFAALQRVKCPRIGGDDFLAALDKGSPFLFDNSYHRNVVTDRGLLHSDQALLSSEALEGLARAYSTDIGLFANDFAIAMIKMSSASPLTGGEGEIRKNCRVVN